MKKSFVTLSVIVLLLIAATQSVWAFSDTKNDPNDTKIAELQNQGIVNGGEDGLFRPGEKLTYAAGVTMIVKGLGLNIDNIRFIKEPKASDYYTNVKDDAWYAQTFIIASLNGLDIPKDVDPAATMTREQFAHHLFKGIIKKGDFAFIEIYVMINDEADINKDYMDSIQKLLIAKIASLDDQQNFYPKKEITRSEAAAWLFDAIQFVEDNKDNTVPSDDPKPLPLTDPQLSIEPINDDVNAVTVTASLPNPGYGMYIPSISFEGDQAIIHMGVTYPEDGVMYPQGEVEPMHVVQAEAVTYISSDYKPVLGDLGGSVSGSAGGGVLSSAGSTGSDPVADNPDAPVSSNN